MSSSHAKGVVAAPEVLRRRIEIARGEHPADLVVRGASWLDVFSGVWRRGDIALADGIVVGVGETYTAHQVIDADGLYIVPGFIDAHVHIESSMMTPDQFARAVLPRGTTTVFWDPHEITNVKGKSGLDWALASTETLAVDVFVMVPSCVPSTSREMKLETSGAALMAADLAPYVNHPRVLGLAEMMNWPGLLSGDKDVLMKLWNFQELRRDGHCPGLKGKDLNAYAVAGIHSCHESTTAAEADEKLSKGIHLLVREGSCAKDADRLLPLLTQRSATSIGFCSDDRNPLDIEDDGHLDCIVNKALKAGHAAEDVFRSASYASAKIYGLENRGAIAPGYIADLVFVKRNDEASWTRGVTVVDVLKRGKNARTVISEMDAKPAQKMPFPGRNLNLKKTQIDSSDFRVSAQKSTPSATCHVIGMRPGQIITDRVSLKLTVHDGSICADLDQDALKIAVFERHHASGDHAVAFVQGMGLKNGAIATSINHDCHNIIVTGSSDELMARAVRELVEMDGGIVVVASDRPSERLVLPIGGLMTNQMPHTVGEALRRLKALAYHCGCRLEEPFLQLSFLALPVIPTLKITDQGLVDGETFQLIPVMEDK